MTLWLWTLVNTTFVHEFSPPFVVRLVTNEAVILSIFSSKVAILLGHCTLSLSYFDLYFFFFVGATLEVIPLSRRSSRETRVILQHARTVVHRHPRLPSLPAWRRGDEVSIYYNNLLSCLTNFKNIQKRIFLKTSPSLVAKKRN